MCLVNGLSILYNEFDLATPHNKYSFVACVICLVDAFYSLIFVSINIFLHISHVVTAVCEYLVALMLHAS